MERSCIRTSEEGLLSVVLFETTKEITGYACGVNTFYITCIRSILEYACPVFHGALPGYLSEYLERLQKRELRIIYPGMSYNQALEFSGLPTLFKRREVISSKLFNEVVGDPGHTLQKLLPSKNPANYFLRRNRPYLCAKPIDAKNLSFLVTFSALSSV